MSRRSDDDDDDEERIFVSLSFESPSRRKGLSLVQKKKSKNPKYFCLGYFQKNSKKKKKFFSRLSSFLEYTSVRVSERNTQTHNTTRRERERAALRGEEDQQREEEEEDDF